MPRQKDNDGGWLFLLIGFCIVVPFLLILTVCEKISRWRINKNEIGWWISTVFGVLFLLGLLIIIGIHHCLR